MRSPGFAMGIGFLLLAASVGASRWARAGTQAYTFTNDTGQVANDLHIEFKHGVNWAPDPPPPFTASSGQGTSTFNASGGNVANGGGVAATFTTTGSGPTIRRGYWTHDGTNIGNLNSGNTNPFP